MAKVPQIIQDVGFDFRWSNSKVWALDFPVEEMEISKLEWHFTIPFWDIEDTDDWNLTPQEVMKYPKKHKVHYQQCLTADLNYPLDIMWNKGRWLLLDGLHRLVRAKMEGKTVISVRKIPREMVEKIQK